MFVFVFRSYCVQSLMFAFYALVVFMYGVVSCSVFTAERIICKNQRAKYRENKTKTNKLKSKGFRRCRETLK